MPLPIASDCQTKLVTSRKRPIIMQEISKIDFEALILAKFLYLNPVRADEIVKTESPDFLVRSNDKILGIEVCQLYHGKEPGSRFTPVENVSMETQIALNAQQYFFRRYRIPLNVDIQFRRELTLDSVGRQRLAEKIAEHVWQEVSFRKHDAYYSISKDRNLPQELVHLFVYFHPKLTKSTWYSGRAIMLPDLTCKMIVETIRKKEAKTHLYRKKADNLILVLAEGFSMESLFDSIEISKELQLRSSYDNIYIVRDLANVLFRVK